jgi:tripartite-type tricarboxylate transporter receptor subunit TctC
MKQCLLAMVAAALGVGAQLALAQSAIGNFPSKPIRILVPFAPGGGADSLARIVTPKLHDELGQAWVVDNRGGAAGNIAAETVEIGRAHV